MKDNTRTIELSLKTAKEWYKQGGNLKEVALQAFNERELTDLPKSWKEFCEMEDGCLIRHYNHVIQNMVMWCIPIYKLNILRNKYIDNWEPDWSMKNFKYCIEVKYNDTINITPYQYTNRFLSFPTEELAQEFAKNFKDLILDAKI